jgi:hypothetical protein
VNVERDCIGALCVNLENGKFHGAWIYLDDTGVESLQGFREPFVMGS